MQTVTKVNNNMWRRAQGGLYTPVRRRFPIDGLVGYFPLWHPELSGSPFLSKDLNAHSCTVKGATWGITGWTFDGSSNNIACGSAASLDDIFDGGGSICVWINPSSDGEVDNGRIVAKYTGGNGWAFYVTGEAAGKVKISFYIEFTTQNGQWTTTATEVTIGTPTFVAITYDNSNVANNPIVYIGNTAKTVGGGLTEVAAPIGTRKTDAAQSFRIGDTDDDNTSFDGVIGDTWAYNSILAAVQVEQMRLATMWRY